MNTNLKQNFPQTFQLLSYNSSTTVSLWMNRKVMIMHFENSVLSRLDIALLQ